MKLDEVKSILAPFNPWWSNPRWSRDDPLLSAVRKSILRKPPRLFYHISKKLPEHGYYGIVTIRGPRRVGKTTLIKMVIEELILRNRIDPKKIFYVPLDYKKLREIDLFELIEAIARFSGEKYVFIDEASMYKEWALVLKNVVDAGLVEQGRLKIVVTGSHSMDLADAASKLRGRQGRLASKFNLGGNLVHTPLRFIEVLEALKPNIDDYLRKHNLRKPDERFSILLELKKGNIPRQLEEFYSEFMALLEEAFNSYLLHGGFPKAIDQYHREEVIDSTFYHDFGKLIISDSENAGLSPENTRRVIEFLTEPSRLSSTIGLEKRENIGKLVVGVDQEGFPQAKFRLGEYLEYLETTRIFFFPYREDKSKKCTPNYRADRKIYVLDPFAYFALRSHVENEADPLGFSINLLKDEGFKGRLVESTVAAHLIMAQQFFEHIPSVDYHKVLFYSRKNSETDYIICMQRQGRKYRFVVESKYRRKIPGVSDANIVLTKDRLEEEVIEGEKKVKKQVHIPVALFLVLF